MSWNYSKVINVERTVYLVDRLLLLPKFIHNFRKYGLNGRINRFLHRWPEMATNEDRQPNETIRTRGWFAVDWLGGREGRRFSPSEFTHPPKRNGGPHAFDPHPLFAKIIVAMKRIRAFNIVKYFEREIEEGGVTTGNNNERADCEKKKDTLLSIMRGKEAINNQSRSFTRAYRIESAGIRWLVGSVEPLIVFY